MSFKEGIESKKEPSKCPQCQLFYGCQAYQGLCSTCYKSQRISKKEEKMQTQPGTPMTPVKEIKQKHEQEIQKLELEMPKKQQKDRKRCFDCNKKVGLLGIECRCGFVYCNAHRLPENHQCDFDHKEKGKDKLKSEVVKIAKSKISQI